MGSKYFNKWEFQRALDLTETDPLEAKLLYENYLEKYPTDYCAYIYYASHLITMGYIKEAEKILCYVEQKHKRDNVFNKKINKIQDLEKNIIHTRMKLLCYQERYAELEKFCSDNITYVENFNNVLFYSRFKNGKLTYNRKNVNSYLFRQIIEYSEEDFLDHIKKHLSEYNEKSEVQNVSVFSPDFPIKEVFEEIKKYIPSDKKLMPGFFENVYVFKYDECGRNNNKLVNYFKVITLHNTSSFITMCPSTGCENLPCIDLNYLKPVKEDVKVKRISRIDKFNQKYNRNQN